MAKLIVLMIDGVSADYYAAERARLPHFAALEARGFRIGRLRSEVLGTSLPGRTSILTGATADMSGVYGNKIWDGTQFRYANPDDIRVPTLPQRARAAGQRVGVIGFGMIRPEDADIFHPPWWVGGMIQRARDIQPQPSDESWLRVAFHQPGEVFQQMCAEAGLPPHLPLLDLEDETQRPLFGPLADLAVFDWVGALAASPHAPDLIMAEFLIPDIFQHNTGYASELSHWSIIQADLALGRIGQRLHNAGVAHEWNIAVLSDHGHSAIETALHTQVILPGVRQQSEGSLLMVAPQSAHELVEAAARLADYGVEPYENDCIPPEYRDQVWLFVAPPGVSFEHDDPEATEPTGKPKAISSHGLRPGAPGDDRFALFHGPDVPQGHAERADAAQVAPTLARILGLPLEGFAAAPVF